MTKQKQSTDLMTVQEVAIKEQVNTKTVYDWIKKGFLTPVFYVGKNKRPILVGKKYKYKKIDPK